MKTSLLFVTFRLSSGGAEKALENLLWELDYDKFDVDVMLFSQDSSLVSIPQQVHVLETPNDIASLAVGKPPVANGVFAEFRYLTGKVQSAAKLLANAIPNGTYRANQVKWTRMWEPCLKTLDREYDVAVGYIHGLPSYYVIDKVKAKRKYLWIHCSYQELNADCEMDRGYFSRADKVITISPNCLEQLKDCLPSLADMFISLPNINRPESIVALSKSVDASGSYAGRSVKVCSIGRLADEKGFDLAILAANELNKEQVDFTWLVLGEGPERAHLEELIGQYGLGDRFMLVGRKTNPYPYLAAADIVVQSSRSEGKSVVLDEAKLLDKTIVSTRYMSVDDQITDGVDGYLCETDCQDIARTILRAIELGKPQGLEKSRQALISDMNASVEAHCRLFETGHL